MRAISTSGAAKRIPSDRSRQGINEKRETDKFTVSREEDAFQEEIQTNADNVADLPRHRDLRFRGAGAVLVEEASVVAVKAVGVDLPT